jgi:ABC-type transporter Mla subunit MlaD
MPEPVPTSPQEQHELLQNTHVVASALVRNLSKLSDVAPDAPELKRLHGQAQEIADALKRRLDAVDQAVAQAISTTLNG